MALPTASSTSKISFGLHTNIGIYGATSRNHDDRLLSGPTTSFACRSFGRKFPARISGMTSMKRRRAIGRRAKSLGEREESMDGQADTQKPGIALGWPEPLENEAVWVGGDYTSERSCARLHLLIAIPFSLCIFVLPCLAHGALPLPIFRGLP
ncbi:hypothetical protein KM043_016993 [Ampulex compressa]|nr:hypothetical protein KM043_016993 [Ampulex compressa]